jgi:hypothetical protein
MILMKPKLAFQVLDNFEAPTEYVQEQDMDTKQDHNLQLLH